jgi:hypothetical protein
LQNLYKTRQVSALYTFRTQDEIELVQVFFKANTLVNLLDADLVTDLAALLDADLYIIAVSDGN